MCCAVTNGLKIGSSELSFSPGPFGTPELDLDTGTAGSVCLVLECLQLAALAAEAPVRFILRGGTDVTGAPSCDYVRTVKLPLLKKMGYQLDFRLLKRGYYPKGGGIINVLAHPPEGSLLQPLYLPESGTATEARGLSHAASTLKKKNVAERQARTLQKRLTDYLHVPAKVETEYGPTRCPGSGITLWAHTVDSVFGASAMGKPEKSAEWVAEEATEKLLRTYHSRASLDPWMGDQILPYLALSSGPSVISVPRLTRHMQTNMWIIQQFLNVRFYCEQENQRVKVHCEPFA
jgi:RNA 3'-phosphate cyclase